MKYGESLPRRSHVWRAFNIDYNQVKKQIKYYTSNGKGSGEAELFVVFQEELEKMDTFVKSKAGEIERRLATCTADYKNMTSANDEMTVSRHNVGKMERIHDEMERKLLKKYDKWSQPDSTSKSNLTVKVNNLVDQKYYFHRRMDFAATLYKLSKLFNGIRNPQIDVTEDEAANGTLNADMRLPRYCRETSKLDSGCLTYWINMDDVIEMEFYLLRHLALQTLASSGKGGKTIHTQQRLHMLYCDSPDKQSYKAYFNNASKITVIPLTVHWSEHIALPLAYINCVNSTTSKRTTIAIKKKLVNDFLRASKDEITSMARSSESSEYWLRSALRIKEYMTTHNLLPVLHCSTTHTRFTNYRANDQEAGSVVASIDNDIYLRHLKPDDVIPTKYAQDSGQVIMNETCYRFPFAVLEVQYENPSGQIFMSLQEMDNNYLLKRVEGFSLFIEGMSKFNPLNQKPSWWSTVNDEFLAVPRAVAPRKQMIDRKPRLSRKASSTAVSSLHHSSPQEFAPSSSTLTSMLEPNGELNKSLLRLANSRSHNTKAIRRYWNEFDYPSDEEANFTVYSNEQSTLLPPTRRQRNVDRKNLQNIGMLDRFALYYTRYSNGLNTLFGDDIYGLEDDGLSKPPPIVRRIMERKLNEGFLVCIVVGLLTLCMWGIVGLSNADSVTGLAICVVVAIVVSIMEIIPLARYMMQGGNEWCAWSGYATILALSGIIVLWRYKLSS